MDFQDQLKVQGFIASEDPGINEFMYRKDFGDFDIGVWSRLKGALTASPHGPEKLTVEVTGGDSDREWLPLYVGESKDEALRYVAIATAFLLALTSPPPESP